MIVALKQIREHILDCGLGITIHNLKKLCYDHQLIGMLNKIEAVENDYELMTRFFENGFDDAHRNELYYKLRCQLYSLILELMGDCIAEQNPTYKQCRINAFSLPREYEKIEEALVGFDQELALASLEENADEKQKDIHNRLLRYRIFLFNLIYTSTPWTQKESEIITQVLLSPLVDVIDQQIILGAMLLAQRTVFDVWKFSTLCEVASKTCNMYVRSRALIGIVLALPGDVDSLLYEEIINESLDNLLSAEEMKQALVDIQTQLLFCMETSQNEKTINEEIIPTLSKNSQQIMLDKETDEQKLDSLLHPDADEKNMEEIESSIDRMRNMQKNGADIFFGSFSHAKSFSFFNTLMNWFCPFYIEHPQVKNNHFKDIPLAFLEKIIGGEMFCNSDKYSFILSLAQVIHHIPKDILKLMRSGEVSPTFEYKPATDVLVRRAYLDDLYRFFNLFSNNGFYSNPFASEEKICFFLNRLMSERFRDSKYALKVGRQLFKHHRYKALVLLLEYYKNDEDIEWLKLYALCQEKNGRYNLAHKYFRKALELAPDNMLLLSRTANAAFMCSFYNETIELYQRYLALSSEEDDTDVEEFQMALCELHTDRNTDGMNRLFRLSYNEPENIPYREAIAWGYMLQNKYDEAVKVYDGVEEKNLSPKNLLRKAIALWLNHNNSDAVATLRRFVELNSNNQEENVLDMLLKQLYMLHLDPEMTDIINTEAMILFDLAVKDKL